MLKTTDIYPGKVIPSRYDNEWTFTYFVDREEFTDEDQKSSITYASYARAQGAMREKVEQLRSEAEK